MHPPQDTTLIAPFWEYVTAPHYVSIHAKFSGALSEFSPKGLPAGFDGFLLRHIGSHWDAILLFAALQRESDEFFGVQIAVHRAPRFCCFNSRTKSFSTISNNRRNFLVERLM